MEFTTMLAGAFVLNVLLGGLLAVSVYAVLERTPMLSAPFGVGIGGAMIFAQAHLGESLLTVTVGEMKTLVIAAAAGGVVGATVVLITLEPERDEERN